jgi:hypothetical protein
MHRVHRDHRAIESEAKRRLADVYDAAQEREEMTAKRGGGERFGRERSPAPAMAADADLSRQEIHEARMIHHD